jgi:DNA-binding transcriptional ArsR family regulator
VLSDIKGVTIVTHDFRKALQTYLATTLGIAVPALSAWPGVKTLPRYLADGFAFHELDLWGKVCLLMVAKQEAPTPVELQRQLRLVERLAGLPVLYGQAEMTARQRQRLLELFVPFVVPGRQLFLPPLGVDLREQYAAQARHHAPALGPAAQAVLLAGLLGYWGMDDHASAIARRFGYSAMTLSRARRELLDRGLVNLQGDGRGARWSLNGTRAAVWQAALPALRSPVLRRMWCNLPENERKRLPMAGLTALAEYSMLAGPAVPAVALSDAAWWSMLDRLPSLRQAEELFEGAVEVEIWSYDPHILIEPPVRNVDRYSLFLSLQPAAEADERVAQALEAMMKDAEE